MFNSIRLLSRILFKNSKISYCDLVKTHRSIYNLGLKDIPQVTVTDIKKVLRQKGVSVQDGCTSITMKCSICAEQGDNSESKIYVNKTTGYFLCPTCSVHGEWNILERLIKKAKVDAATKELIDKYREDAKEFEKGWQNILNTTTSFRKLNEIEVQDLFGLFEYPCYPDATKSLTEIRVSNDRTIIYYPLFNALDKVIGYRKIQAGREDDMEHHGLHIAGIFRCKVFKSKSDQAILVPNIQDLLHLTSHKVPGTLIWLTNCTLPPIMLPVLENYSKLCLWGDWNNMRTVAEKLGEERCCFVKPTDGLVTASEAATAGLVLRPLVEGAKPAAHRSITTFAALRDDVYADLTNIDKVRGVKWRRFPALTRLLGGHRRGELSVLTGPTGCGKTTLCAEMSLDLAQQGVNTLWGSFEIRNSRLARTMLHQFSGVPLEKNLQDFQKYADEFEKLPIYYLAFHGQQPIKVVMEAVEHARYVHDIAHVIVDNVQFMLGMGGEREGQDRYFRQDAVITAFRTFATTRHCHVTLVMHPRKERESEDLSTSSIFGSAKASQEADNVLIIQDKRLTAVRGKKYLQIAKNRYSGDLGIVPLDFDKDALSYQHRKKPKTTKPGQEDSVELTTDNDDLSSHTSEADLVEANTEISFLKQAQTTRQQNIKSKYSDSQNYLQDILNANRNR